MNYLVRFFEPASRVTAQKVVDARDAAAARRQLESNGVLVLSIKPERNLWPRTTPVPAGHRNSSRASFALFCRELRTLVMAGMTVVEAVDTLAAKSQQSGHPNGLAQTLLNGLQQGQALSVAIGALPDAPPVLVAAVRAGEHTGNLREALDDYLKFNVLVEQLRKKVVSAALYPAIVLALGIGITLFLLLVVLPNFARMYQNLQGAATGGTAFMIRFSVWMNEHRLMVCASLATAMGGAAIWIATGGARRAAMAAIRLVPWVRRSAEDFQLALVYQAMSLLLKGGYPMVQAMQIAGKSALAGSIGQRLQAAQLQVEKGGAVSAALSASSLCDEVGRRLMAASERNGDFHLATAVVSQMYGERFELFVERTMRVIEPVLLMLVALVVGGVVIMMYLPVFDMATRLR